MSFSIRLLDKRSLTLGFVCLLMIPIDITLASDPSLMMGIEFNLLFKGAFFELAIQSSLLMVTFLVLPFCFFCGESKDDLAETPINQR